MEFSAFQIANFFLAALIYALLGRFLMSLLFEPQSEARIWRVLVISTNPVVKAVRVLTPHLVPINLVVLFAILWALLARIGLFMALTAAAPRPGAGA
ncbi:MULTISPECIES: YggT family protein [Rhodomicrobium]|uniref:YggT family protein n=1 Tax=Rhodomicrobium TaxID=1068 RepID=UPI000B4AA5DA|nr:MULTISPECIES: YggT family protein [Rhodomicrobium]